MIRKILTFPNPLLRKTTDTETLGVWYQNDRERFQSVINDLRENLVASKDGVALAAPQIGIGYNALVIYKNHKELEPIVKQYGDVFFNATYESVDGETDIMREGCLSFPGFYVDVKRFKKVKIKSKDVIFANVEFVLEGFPARVFQHEIQHLSGILFIDHLSGSERIKIAKQILKNERRK